MAAESPWEGESLGGDGENHPAGGRAFSPSRAPTRPPTPLSSPHKPLHMPSFQGEFPPAEPRFSAPGELGVSPPRRKKKEKKGDSPRSGARRQNPVFPLKPGTSWVKVELRELRGGMEMGMGRNPPVEPPRVRQGGADTPRRLFSGLSRRVCMTASSATAARGFAGRAHPGPSRTKVISALSVIYLGHPGRNPPGTGSPTSSTKGVPQPLIIL